MAQQRMRSFEMHEIVRRVLSACLDEAFAIATDDCDGVFVAVVAEPARGRVATT